MSAINNTEKPISVEDAILSVLQNVVPLSINSIPVTKSLGLTLSEDIVASASFPAFPASIMDGYAVRAPLTPGIYEIQETIHAGAVPTQQLKKGLYVSYITTGAMLPTGANAVVKIEDTELYYQDKSNKNGKSIFVVIKVHVGIGTHIRQIGSDIMQNETVLSKSQVIGPCEIGLLATIGVTTVNCYRKPIIGVLSTGNELIDLSSRSPPTGSQIIDTNRPSLIASFLEDNQTVIDLGIIKDSKEEMKRVLLQAATRCDIVVTSGGVSMGAADFVKPLLNEIGVIHFGKLNMKPGKPTTFASFFHHNGDESNIDNINNEKNISNENNNNTDKIINNENNDALHSIKKTYFFGLPGNPVSCLVTKSLFIDVAIKRLQGLILLIAFLYI
jgi:gephyrin